MDRLGGKSCGRRLYDGRAVLDVRAVRSLPRDASNARYIVGAEDREAAVVISQEILSSSQRKESDGLRLRRRGNLR